MPILGKQRQNNTVEYMLRRLWTRIPTLFGFAAFFLIAGQALAHERWILSPDQIAEWNAHPRPILYSELSPLNVTMISLFLLFILGWVRLGCTGARELFPDLQAVFRLWNGAAFRCGGVYLTDLVRARSGAATAGAGVALVGLGRGHARLDAPVWHLCTVLCHSTNHNDAAWRRATRSSQRPSARHGPPLLRGLLLLRRVQF
jgi:hypothetical protein